MTDRAEQYRERFDARVRAVVRALISDELIAEHAADPTGERTPHGPELTRVLNFLRRQPSAGKQVVVTSVPWREYRIGLLGGARGEPVRVLDEPVFASEAEAMHGVFLARVRALLADDTTTADGPGPAGVGDGQRRAAIHGYCPAPSVAAGERARFHVSCELPGDYEVDIVRLVHGDTNPAGPGLREHPVDLSVVPARPGRLQPIRPGSHVEVPDRGRLRAVDGLTLHAFVQPTAPGGARQALMARFAADAGAGYALSLDETGRLTFAVGDGDGGHAQVVAPFPLRPSTWYAVAATWDRERDELTLSQRPVVSAVNGLLGPAARIERPWSGTAPAGVAPAGPDVPFLIAGWSASAATPGLVEAHFNGKVDSPRVYGRALGPEALVALDGGADPGENGILARWSFAAGIGRDGVPSDRVVEVSGHGLHGSCVNQPARASTGWNWSGREDRFIHAPAEYGAIHFHDSDLDDARWDEDFALDLPPTLRSGIYAARLRQGEAETRIPFFVPPRRGTATARVLLLVPTATYQAYANDRLALEADVSQAVVAHTPVLTEEHLFLQDHPEYGLSTYDLHADGSGVAYSTWRRPILTLGPDFRHGTGSVWGLAADLHLVDWLEHEGIAYDVATDHDLHAEGAALLERYRVVLTGTHPEYSSEQMLDAVEAYVAGDGRLMYLGGNGFYWVVSFDPAKPWVMEVRRGENGCRAWQARPGECFHSTTGEKGGLWRNRARPPQKIVGVGFTSEGFDGSSHYARMPDGLGPAGQAVFDGVRDPDRLGAFGLVGGGAAGHELDRYELALGTPPDALLLASSEGHSDNYPLVAEENMFPFPGTAGTQDARIRADLVLFRTPGGGAVFSTGSIAWCGSLSADRYDNDVARVTHNVLEAFLADELPIGQDTR